MNKDFVMELIAGFSAGIGAMWLFFKMWTSKIYRDLQKEKDELEAKNTKLEREKDSAVDKLRKEFEKRFEKQEREIRSLKKTVAHLEMELMSKTKDIESLLASNSALSETLKILQSK